MMSDTYFSSNFGQLNEAISNIKNELSEMKADVKSLLLAGQGVDSRLKNGQEKFVDHECRLRNLEGRTMPMGRIYALIVMGFTILGVLIKVG